MLPQYFLPLLELLQMMNAVVADTNAADFALVHTFHKSAPGAETVLFAAIRRMEKVEINVFQPASNRIRSRHIAIIEEVRALPCLL